MAEVAVPRSEFHKVVVREGDDSATCYVVRSGHARATPGHRDGRVLTLATFEPGDISGRAQDDHEAPKEHTATWAAQDAMDAGRAPWRSAPA